MDEGILKGFLKSISSEVYNMLFTEWNQEKALEVRYREGKKEGRTEGMKEEREKGRKEFIALLKSGKSPEEMLKLYDKNGL